MYVHICIYIYIYMTYVIKHMIIMCIYITKHMIMMYQRNLFCLFICVRNIYIVPECMYVCAYVCIYIYALCNKTHDHDASHEPVLSLYLCKEHIWYVGVYCMCIYTYIVCVYMFIYMPYTIKHTIMMYQTNLFCLFIRVRRSH